ncbi:MAG: hypothetical protein KAH18_10075 [Psychromonas sp.]|nr:hypothetical protein [Psychromonas sp.]
MRSSTSKFLFDKSSEICSLLYQVRVNDPLIPTLPEQRRVPTARELMGFLTDGAFAGAHLPGMTSVVELPQSPVGWFMQGHRTFNIKEGNSYDFAAMAATQLYGVIAEYETGASLEVINGLNHPFAVVNRKGLVKCVETWGQNAFVIDPWHQNQFPQGSVEGNFWVLEEIGIDLDHQIRNDIRENCDKLELLITIEEGNANPESNMTIPSLPRTWN